EGRVDQAASFHRTASYPAVSTTPILARPGAGFPRVCHHAGLGRFIESTSPRSCFMGVASCLGTSVHRNGTGAFQFAGTLGTDYRSSDEKLRLVLCGYSAQHAHTSVV